MFEHVRITIHINLWTYKTTSLTTEGVTEDETTEGATVDEITTESWTTEPATTSTPATERPGETEGDKSSFQMYYFNKPQLSLLTIR